MILLLSLAAATAGATPQGVDAASAPSHVSSSLAEGIALAQGDRAAFVDWQRRRPGPSDDTGMAVVLEASDDPELLADQLAAQGFAVQAVGGDLVQIWAPWDDLASLADASAYRVREPFLARPKALPAEKGILTHGYASMGIEDWHDRGHEGKGVTIAVLDIGFYGYEELLGDDLPKNVSTKFFDNWDQSDHGTAVAEVIHDIAPKADLLLWQFTTDAEFLDAVDKLQRRDVQIINASIGFDNIWHADGSSPYSEAVDEAVLSGLVWVGAAGNENERYRVGLIEDEDRDGRLEIDGQEGIWVYAPETLEVSFRWSEPMGGAAIDIDLKAYGEDGSLCATSKNVQSGSQDPYEEIRDAECVGTYVEAVPIVDLERDFDLTGLQGFLYGFNGIEGGAQSYERNLTLPADAKRGIAVAACDYEQESVASFSSRGPTEDGRVKPDFCAPMSADTTIAGDFSGTSAASPHLAGYAAIIMGSLEDPTPSDVKAWMRASAVDLGEEGPDTAFGMGAIVAGRTPTRGCVSGLVPLGITVMGFGAGLLARRRETRR